MYQFSCATACKLLLRIANSRKVLVGAWFLSRASLSRSSSMNMRRSLRVLTLAALVALSLALLTLNTAAGNKLANPLLTPNAPGTLATFNKTGGIHVFHPFFQELGTNGRTCNSCHVSSEAWTVTPAGVQARFNATGGHDPIFRTNDGSNWPSADVSTVAAREAAYSMLLDRGLIRVSVHTPESAEFT